MEELEAQSEVWNHIFRFITSMSVKCAVELRVPDAIHAHGGNATLPQLAAALSLPPAKLADLRRLMRMLVHAGCFAKQEDDVYALTPWSRLLVSSEHTAVAPFVVWMLHPLMVQSWHSLGAWFHGRAPTPFAATHGKGIFETTREQPGFAAVFNEAMASDCRLVGQVLVKKHAEVLEGARSMVDVGGGTGTLAAIVAEAFPHMKCTFLELPHVVAAAAGARKPNNLDVVGGNMFDHIPSADVILYVWIQLYTLQWVLHDWKDAECVKILKRCREAIPSKQNGGKVIVIDIVLQGDEGSKSDKSRESQLFLDMLMMTVSGGMQREEHEWRKIFTDAGFSSYTIKGMGLRSLIEVYP
ncbi:unnamed protein product [Musa acuminata var. zebrina]